MVGLLVAVKSYDVRLTLDSSIRKSLGEGGKCHFPSPFSSTVYEIFNLVRNFKAVLIPGNTSEFACCDFQRHFRGADHSENRQGRDQ